MFKRSEFVAQSKEFVRSISMPIRQWVSIETIGYPSVILLSPDCAEVMRMPNSIPVEQYAAALDSAMERMRPVEAVLDEVMEVGPCGS